MLAMDCSWANLALAWARHVLASAVLAAGWSGRGMGRSRSGLVVFSVGCGLAWPWIVLDARWSGHGMCWS